MKKFLYFFLHIMSSCPDKDLVEVKRGKMKCCKCDREYFKFTSY